MRISTFTFFDQFTCLIHFSIHYLYECQSKFEQEHHYCFRLFLIVSCWDTIHFDFPHFTGILKPFLKDIIRNFVLTEETIHEARPRSGTESKTFQDLHCYT